MILDPLSHRVILDPADAQDNAIPPVWVSVGNAGSVSGATPAGFYRTTTGTRWRFTSNARRVRVLVYCEAVYGPIGIRVTSANGTVMRDYWSSETPTAGRFCWVTFDGLPAGGTTTRNTIELFQPSLNASGAGGAASGCYLVMADFDAPATRIAPTTTGGRLIIGDSISVGANMPLASQQGFVGRLQRGASFGGVAGRVMNWSWGFRMLRDIANGSTLQNTTAAAIATLAPAKIDIMLGTNDWLAGGWSASAYQSGLTGLLNALAATGASATPVNVVGILLTTGREGTGSSGDNMDAYRAAQAAAVAATTKSSVAFRDGKAVLSSGDIATDGVHVLESGHAKMLTAMLSW